MFLLCFFECYGAHRALHVLTHAFPTRRSSDLLAACAVAYAVSIPYSTPDYLDNIVPMVATAYHGYDASWEMLLLRPWVMIWSCIAALLLILRADIAKQGEPLIIALLIVALAFGLSSLLQRQGWLYHSIRSEEHTSELKSLM